MGILDVLAPEAATETEARIREIPKQGSDRFESCHRRKDGTIFPVEISAFFRSSQGGRYFAFVRSTEERTESNTELRDRQLRLQRIIEGEHVGTWEWNVQSGEVVFNPKWAEMVGYTLAELAPASIKTWETLCHPDDLKRSAEALERHFAGEAPYYVCECRIGHKAGHWIWVHDRGSVLTWTDDGKPLMMFGTHTEITDRKRSEEALKESEGRLREVLENSLAASYKRNLATNSYEYLSPVFTRIAGYTPEEMKSLPTETVLGLMHPDDLTEVKRAMAESMSDRAQPAYQLEYRFKCKDGQYRWLLDQFSMLKDTGGNTAAFVGSVHDITQRKVTDEALRESMAQYRLLFELGSDALFLIDTETGMILDSNRVASELYGYTRDEMRSKRSMDMSAEPEETGRLTKEAKTYDGGIVHIPYRLHRKKDGTAFPVEITCRAFPMQGRRVLIVSARDISERVAAEHALRESNGRYSAILNNERAAIGIFDSETLRIVDVNEAHVKLYGYRRKDLIGMSIFELSAEREESIASVKGAFGSPSFYLPLRWHRKKDGTAFPVEIVGGRYEWQGRQMMFAMVLDISDRMENEDKLRRLHKVESLERMAGGVAHHFNNQLATVMGNLEMASVCLPTGAQAAEYVTSALEASQRAAKVSGSMLTYLGKANAAFDLIDLSEVCRSHLPLVQAAAAGGKEACVVTVLPSPGPSIRGNANQIQQALSNLISNAVEAIPDYKGTVRLSVKWAGPTDIPKVHRCPSDWEPYAEAYGCLEVADSGSGMRKNILEKLFEPFFSTKFTGRGLGLPLVYGIMRAHGGVATVQSENGKGSIFSLFFPIVERRTPEVKAGSTSPRSEAARPAGLSRCQCEIRKGFGERRNE
jgi:PAS domain S-box-containing protein